MKISLSQFTAFTAKTTTSAKMKYVREAKNKGYVYDYWRDLRNNFHKFLQGQITAEKLEDLSSSATERKNTRQNYILNTNKFEAFFSHRKYKYLQAPNAIWTSNDESFSISASPEFMLEMDKKNYLVKIYYRKKKQDEKLTKINISSTLLLMDKAKYSFRPENSIPAVLNLQTNKFVTINDLRPNATTTLIGDIAMFKALWDVV